MTWHTADSMGIGPASAIAVEIAAARRMRIVLTSSDHQPLVTADLDQAALYHWAQSARVGLALGARSPTEFQSSVALQPAVRDADSTGYVITIADGLGANRSVYATGTETRSFLHAIAHAATRLDKLSDERLMQLSALPPDSVVERCDLIQDSLIVATPPGSWPLAKPTHALPLRDLRPPGDAQPGKPVSAVIVLFADGTPDSTFFGVTGTRDSGYRARVLDYFMKEKWIPGEVSGCPVIGRASLTTMGLGISRTR